MQQLLTYLRTKIKSWKDNRFLRKHGCEDWEQYHYRYDPDIWKIATRIKDYYRGYPYVYCIENRNHKAYEWDLAYDGMYVINKWMKANCKDKFRLDYHRAMNAPSTGWEWQINELGGGDYVFAAFKTERDLSWFLMRWS